MKLQPLALAFALTTLPAQEPFKVSDYVPNDYRVVMRADLKAMRDQGIWDELENGAMKMLLAAMERESGFALVALDRVMMVASFAADAPPRHDPDRIVIMEGNAQLELPHSATRNTNYQPAKIGGHDVLVHSQSSWLYFQPRPEVRIEGARAALEPMLSGKPSAGQPCADILSLRSTRKDSLVEMAFDLTIPTLRDETIGKLFADTEWPEGQAPQFLYARMHAIGDADDPHFGVELVLRHVGDGDGVAVTEKAIDGLLAKVAAEPKLKMVQQLLAKLERTRDRGDLILKLDLGRARDAGGKLAMAMMATMTTSTEVQAAQVAPAPPPPPKPADPAKKQ